MLKPGGDRVLPGPHGHASMGQDLPSTAQAQLREIPAKLTLENAQVRNRSKMEHPWKMMIKCCVYHNLPSQLVINNVEFTMKRGEEMVLQQVLTWKNTYFRSHSDHWDDMWHQHMTLWIRDEKIAGCTDLNGILMPERIEM